MQKTSVKVVEPRFACAKHGLNTDCSCQRYNLNSDLERLACKKRRHRFRSARSTRFEICMGFFHVALFLLMGVTLFLAGFPKLIPLCGLVVFLGSNSFDRWLEKRLLSDNLKALDDTLLQSEEPPLSIASQDEN